MTTSITAAKKTIKAAASLLFWLAVWYLASAGVGKALILPSPIEVWKQLLILGATAGFWLSAGQSLLNVFVGFLSGVTLGVLFVVLTSCSRLCNIILSPLIRVVRATPVASFIILALLWIGKTWVPAFCSALMVLPVVWQSVFTAVNDTDRALLEMAHMYDFGRFRTLVRVYIPSVRTAFGAACATSMGLAWKSGIAAEVLSMARPSIGAELYYSKIYLETPALFAWTAIVIILSLILEKGLALLMRARQNRKKSELMKPAANCILRQNG